MPNGQRFYLCILLHELAHLLRRTGSRTRNEHYINITPPASLNVPEDIKRNSERIELLSAKGEAGFELEVKIFGCIITKLNPEAADAIISIGNESLKEFQPSFMKILETYNSATIELHRDDGSLQLGQYLMRYTDDFHTIIKRIEF